MAILDCIQELHYYDNYNLIQQDIKRLQINNTSKDILLYIANGYTIQDVSDLTGLTVKSINNRLYYLSKNKDIIKLLKGDI